METVKRWVISLLLILLAFSPAFCETQVRNALIFFHFSDDAGFTSLEKTILEQTLIIQLGELEQVSVVINPENEIPEDRDRSALFAGADSWVDLQLSGNKEAVHMEWKIRDVQEAEDIFESSIDSYLDKDYLTLYGSFWNSLTRSIENTLKPIDITGILYIEALAGSTILGLEESPLYINDTGLLEIVLSAPAVYSIGIQLEGYYPENHRFFLHKDERIEIVEKQKKKSMFSFEGGLFMFGFPTLAVNYQIPQTPLYVSLGSDIFLLGITPGNSGEDEQKPQILNGSGLLNINFEIGYILESRKGFFRYPFGVGAFLRLTPTEETNGFVDAIIPWGMNFSASIDYRLKRNFIIFYEWKPAFYFSSDGYFFTEAFYNDYIQLGDNVFLDLPLFILGVRWSP